MKRRYQYIFIAVAALAAAHVQAESSARKAPVIEDFTFKRVKVPKRGASPTIDVQIDPVEQARVLSAASARARAHTESLERAQSLGESVPSDLDGANAELDALLAKKLPHEWFWSVISPKIEASGPGRLATAVLHLNKAPPAEAISGPRLQSLQDITLSHGTEIMIATIGTKVSPAFVLALISVESGGRVDVTSSAGANGLMQLMPATAERFGVTDAADAAQNIKGGVAYLDWLMEKFDSDPILVLAGYNAGENAVIDNGGVPPYAETRGYVPKVLAAWEVARGLCLTPPQLVTDGCVFANKNEVSSGEE